MIRYRLICRCTHEFDAWFSSSSAYDTQEANGQVQCPSCRGHEVKKALMAPRIATTSHAPADMNQPSPPPSDASAPATAAADAAVPTSVNPDRIRALMGELRQMRDRVMANSENVGANFAEEARRIHYEEAPDRAIYGEASPEDVRQLNEEGIDILPLPRLPDDLS